MNKKTVLIITISVIIYAIVISLIGIKLFIKKDNVYYLKSLGHYYENEEKIQYHKIEENGEKYIYILRVSNDNSFIEIPSVIDGLEVRYLDVDAAYLGKPCTRLYIPKNIILNFTNETRNIDFSEYESIIKKTPKYDEDLKIITRSVSVLDNNNPNKLNYYSLPENVDLSTINQDFNLTKLDFRDLYANTIYNLNYNGEIFFMMNNLIIVI